MTIKRLSLAPSFGVIGGSGDLRRILEAALAAPKRLQSPTLGPGIRKPETWRKSICSSLTCNQREHLFTKNSVLSKRGTYGSIEEAEGGAVIHQWGLYP